MKLELILFFVVACMAQKEDNNFLDECSLPQDSFADKATLPFLDSYIVGKRELIIPCYLSAKKSLDDIAFNLKYNLTTAEFNSKIIDSHHQKVAYFPIKFLQQVGRKIKSCHKEIWEEIEKNQLLKAVYAILYYREKISNLIDHYESQLEKIKNQKLKDLVKRKVDEIISETEEKFDKVNEVFEKCVNSKTSNH